VEMQRAPLRRTELNDRADHWLFSPEKAAKPQLAPPQVVGYDA